MIWRIILIILIAYIVYKLVFHFLIPLFNTTRKIKKDFREMHDKMNEFMKKQQEPPAKSKESSPKSKAGDYIDFEEIK
jgi:hypothetical protein